MQKRSISLVLSFLGLVLLIAANTTFAIQIPESGGSTNQQPLPGYIATMPEISDGSSLTSFGTINWIVADDPFTVPTSTTIARTTAAMPTQSGKGLSYVGEQTSQLNGFNIVIQPGTTLQANTAALAAFERAAALWEARISDPITIYIDADLSGGFSSSNIIGQASTTMVGDSYNNVRSAMIADAAGESDDSVTSYLPTASGFNAYVPDGFALEGYVIGAQANFKALGYSAISNTDATITFNTEFSFDYDNSDGVSPGTVDFETVAAHELGHALGFVSRVDYIDYNYIENPTSDIDVNPTTLDLFRFNEGGPNDPETFADFTSITRSLMPGDTANTDQIDSWGTVPAELAMSTGDLNGDGRQASHWKDNDLTGSWTGIMDPTLGYGTVWDIAETDFRALDLIGYDIISAVPEPTTAVLLLAGLLSGLMIRQKSR